MNIARLAFVRCSLLMLCVAAGQTLACADGPAPLPDSPAAWPGGMFDPSFAP